MEASGECVDDTSVQELVNENAGENSWAAAAVEYARICGKLKKTPRTGWTYRNIPHHESVADHSWRMAAMCLLLHEPRRVDNVHHTENVVDSLISRRKSETVHGGNSANINSVINVAKCMEMAIFHDLAEAITGDIAPADKVAKEEKHLLEAKAIRTIASVLDRTEINTFDKSIGGVHHFPSGQENCSSSPCGSASSTYLQNLIEQYESRTSEESIAVKDMDLLDMIIQADEYETDYPKIDLSEFFVGTQVARFRNERVRAIAAEVHRQRNCRRCNDQSKRFQAYANIFKPTKETKCCDDCEARNRDSTLLDDKLFCSCFASTSGMKKEDVEKVVAALRSHDSRQ